MHKYAIIFNANHRLYFKKIISYGRTTYEAYKDYQYSGFKKGY